MTHEHTHTTHTGAQGADRLTPRARDYLRRNRGRVCVRVAARGSNARMCAELGDWGWLSLESYQGGVATYTVVAVPTAPDAGRSSAPAPTANHKVGDRVTKSGTMVVEWDTGELGTCDAAEVRAEGQGRRG